MKKAIETGVPRTLMQAHEKLVRIRPGSDAPPQEWLRYYERSVTMYELIAEIDPGHEVKARYWAQRERHRARDIAARIGAGSSRG